MSAMTTALLRLYPRAWRRRYGAEMDAMLAGEPLTPRTLVDLLAGAIDARLNPQIPEIKSGHLQGVAAMTKTATCNPKGLTTGDQVRSAGWMIGGSLVMVGMAIWLKISLGSNVWSEGLLYGAFPASMMLSMESTYLKCYSRTARGVISVGGSLLILLMMWASVAIAYRI
jgi:hypothetical protein